MSFGFLPWPLYVLMILIANIVCFVWLIETWREHPKVLIIGFVFAGIGSIVAGICRVIKETGFLRSDLDLLSLSGLTGLCSVLGVVLLYIGCYMKVKDDIYKKRLVLLITLVVAIVVALCLW